MIKSKRFEPIQEIASTSAKDLSRAMGEAGLKVTDLERQLEQLKSYRDEYLRNSTQSTVAIDAAWTAGLTSPATATVVASSTDCVSRAATPSSTNGSPRNTGFCDWQVMP